MSVFTSKLVLNSLLPALLRLTAAFTQFGATLLVARVLGDTAASPFFFWSSVLMSVAVFSTFGLDKLLLKHTPLIGHDKNRLSVAIAEARTLVVTVSLIVGIIVAVYAISIDQSDISALYWLVCLPAGVVGIALCRTNAEALKGMSHPNIAILYRQLVSGFAFLVMLLVFLPQLSAKIVLILYVTCFMVTGVMAYQWPGFNHLGNGYQAVNLNTVPHKLAAGLPICIGTVFLSLALIIPLAILEHTNPPAEVSHLTTAYRVFILINLLAAAAYATDLPALAVAGTNNNLRKIIQIYRKMVFTTFGIFAIPALLIIAGARFVMLMFGESFVSATPTLQILMSFLLVSLILGPTDELLLMINKTRAIAYAGLFRLIIAVTAGLLLIPRFGAAGMAFTLGAGILAQKGFSLFCYWKYQRNLKTA